MNEKSLKHQENKEENLINIPNITDNQSIDEIIYRALGSPTERPRPKTDLKHLRKKIEEYLSVNAPNSKSKIAENEENPHNIPSITGNPKIDKLCMRSWEALQERPSLNISSEHLRQEIKKYLSVNAPKIAENKELLKLKEETQDNIPSITGAPKIDKIIHETLGSPTERPSLNTHSEDLRQEIKEYLSVNAPKIAKNEELLKLKEENPSNIPSITDIQAIDKLTHEILGSPKESSSLTIYSENYLIQKIEKYSSVNALNSESKIAENKEKPFKLECKIYFLISN
jgi:hypothetical protein